jgi:broad specificity phosphatase PhoE
MVSPDKLPSAFWNSTAAKTFGRDMNKLILIKHSVPQIHPDMPSSQWELSDKGVALCTPLADLLAQHEIGAIVASEEPKALQTARLLVERLGVAVAIEADLREHDRTGVPHMETRDFISAVAQLFQQPAERVLGQETANQARVRFTGAVESCIARHSTGNLAVVSHGTVIALYLEAVTQLKGFSLWRAMGLPSYVVLNWPTRDVLESVYRVG